MNELIERYLGAVIQNNAVFVNHPIPEGAVVGHLELYKYIQSELAAGREVNEPTLYLNLKDKPWWPGARKISDMTAVAYVSMAGMYAKKIKEEYRKNRFKRFLEDSLQNFEEITLEKAQGGFAQILQDDNQTAYETFDKVCKEYLGELMDGNDARRRIHIGSAVLDDQWVLDNGGLHIIAARPGMGKTSFAVWLMSQMILQGTPALFVSLEMPKRQILDKLFSSWKGSRPTFEDGVLIQEKAHLPLLISDRASQTVESVCIYAQMAKQHHSIGLVVLDYIQLLRTAERLNNREQQISYISQSLKNLAKSLDCPVIALSQLNREVEKRSGKRPQLADLRESGGIEQDADSVLLLYRSEYYYELEKKEVPQDEKNGCELIIAKQRNYATGTLRARWRRDINNWFEFSKRGF